MDSIYRTALCILNIKSTIGRYPGCAAIVAACLLGWGVSPASGQDLDELLGDRAEEPVTEQEGADEPKAAEAERSGPTRHRDPTMAEGTAETPGAPAREEAAPDVEAGVVGSAHPADPAAAPRQRVIEEILVTAQKREQAVQDVPISLSVVDDEFMREANITDFRDLALYVPNVSVNNTSGTFNDIRIRGFGSPLTNKAFEQPVGLVIDGVPYGRLPYWQGPLFDLERVEVLRGPQGTLFGKNTTAGLFNVITKKPTEEFTGYAHAELGELDHRRFEGAIGGPLVANLLNFRLSALSDERDGIMKNTTARIVAGARERMGGRDRQAFRTQLGLPNLAGANVVVGYEWSQIEALGVAWEFRQVTDNQAPFFREYDPGTDFEPGNFVGSIEEREFKRSTIHTVVANAGYDLRGWGLDAVMGHSYLEDRNHDDNDFTPAPMFPIDNRDDNPQTVFELRTSSPSFHGLFGLERLFGLALGRSDLIAGVFFMDRKIDDSIIGFGGNFAILGQYLATDATGVVPPCPGCEAALEEIGGFFNQSTTSLAGFSHVNWYPRDRWTLEYGMRFTHEEKEADWAATCNQGTCAGFMALLGAEQFTAKQSRSEFAFTPKVTLRYDWTDEINLYAGWGLGFKAGGYNAIVFTDNDPAGFSFEPEKASSWELGSKMSLFSGAASLNLALYRQDVTDLQVFTVTPQVTFVVENAAEARSQGVEADLTWLPAHWLTVRGSLGLADTEFLDFPIGTCSFDRTNTDGDSDSRCDLSGRPLEHTPQWTSTVTGIVRYPLSSLFGGPRIFSVAGIDLLGGLTLDYKDVYYANITLDPRTRQPSSIKLNANVGFGNLTQGWSLRLNAHNLTDEVTAIHIRDTSIVGKTFVQVPEPPRIIFGELRWEF